jgi:hypothetical protein
VTGPGAPAGRGALAPLLLVATVWLVQGGVVLAYLYAAFWQSRLGSVMHLGLLTMALCLVFLTFSSPAARRMPFELQRWLLAGTLGTIHAGLLLFHVGTILGHRNWGGPVTRDLLRAYEGQWDQLLSSVGLAAPALVFMLLAPWLLLVGCYRLASASLMRALKGVSRHHLGRARQRASWRAAGWLFVGVFSLIYLVSRGAWLDREPLHRVWWGTTFSTLGPPGLFNNRATRRRLLPPSVREGAAIRPRPVVLITVDALRSDQMGVYGAAEDTTPFLTDQWRRHVLHRVDSAYATCTTSICGLLGTLSSKYWHQLTAPPANLADALKQLGYRNYFFLSGDHTHFFWLRELYGPSIDEYHDGSSEGRVYANDDSLVLHRLQALRWPTTQPAFLFVHLMSLHQIGLRRPEFQRWRPFRSSIWDRMRLTWSPVAVRNHYHNGILQADDTIREIFHLLAEKGVLEQALVIISADHGEYLGELGRFGHGFRPYEPVSRIPLLIYDRTRGSYPLRKLASQVDIAPTVLHAIGAAIPAGWSGVPLQEEYHRNVVGVASFDTSGIVAELDGRRYKYLQDTRNGAEWLFDLESASGEEVSIATLPSAASLLSNMRRLHIEFIASTPDR